MKAKVVIIFLYFRSVDVLYQPRSSQGGRTAPTVKQRTRVAQVRECVYVRV